MVISLMLISSYLRSGGVVQLYSVGLGADLPLGVHADVVVIQMPLPPSGITSHGRPPKRFFKLQDGFGDLFVVRDCTGFRRSIGGVFLRGLCVSHSHS